MVGKYKAYPKYKDSGIEWLGGIPSDWTSKKIKYFTSCNDDVLSELTKKDSIIEYVDISSVSSTKGIEKTKYILFRDAPSRARRCVQDGDIIVSTVRTYLEAITQIKNPPNNLVVSTGFAVIRGKSKIDQTFLAYALKEKTFLNKVITLSVGISYPAINTSDLISIKVSFPNIDEQKQIANFLDHETVKIDTLIEKQQQLIKLLEEKRQAVISHTVTKGLNPNVSMKDSGVEWLGAIPEHWQTVAIGRLFDRVKRTGYAEKELLSVYRDYGVIPKSSRDDNFNKSSQDLSSYQLVNPNDLVINKMKTWQGSIAISNYEGIVSPAYFIFKPNKKMYSHFITKYIHYLLRTPIYVSQYLARSKGIRVNQWDLDPEEFRKIKLVIPTKNEQLQSIEYIEKYEEKINKLISKAIQQINLLKERRTTLISAAVTGKIDVRDWQAPTVTD